MEKTPKNAKIFNCEKCDFRCSKKSEYDRHLRTAKHRNRTILNDFAPKNAEYVCECGKRYTARNSLWYHKKKCTYNESSQNDNVEVNEDSNMEYLLKENLEMKKDNLEMKKMMIDMCKKMEPISINNNINNNITNNNNQIFNIQVFLNEDCKDAMNITEFIESIQLSIEDVEKIGEDGQTLALSNILSSRLNDLDIFKRPVHCSDPQKEIIYVKDEDKWEQEENGKPKLKKALDKITQESLAKVPEMPPDEDKCLKTITEILKDPREDKKILSKVSKELVVN